MLVKFRRPWFGPHSGEVGVRKNAVLNGTGKLYEKGILHHLDDDFFPFLPSTAIVIEAPVDGDALVAKAKQAAAARKKQVAADERRKAFEEAGLTDDEAEKAGIEGGELEPLKTWGKGGDSVIAREENAIAEKQEAEKKAEAAKAAFAKQEEQTGKTLKLKAKPKADAQE